MSPTATEREAKPYKGLVSYQAEDADLFFGRDREADQLLARVLSGRLTLLHARSGAGKTSLLNARLLPGLEARGWGAVRIRPHNDPVASVLGTVLQYVLPPPEAEWQALDRARAALGGNRDDLTLDELLGLHDGLEARDASRRTLLAPVELPWSASEGARLQPVRFLPWFCRLLRSSITIEEFAEHLAAVRQGTGAPSDRGTPVTGKTPVRDLLGALAEPALAASYAGLLALLNVPIPDFCTFFENLFEVYGRRRSQFALVLVFDQFEELFTRFVDPGPAAEDRRRASPPGQDRGLASLGRAQDDLPDWRLRWEFFDQLKRLYEREVTPPAGPAGGGTEPGPSRLPLRYLIALRDEYVAQLDPVRRFAGDLDAAAYHLDLLGTEAARAAIQEPARLFGYTYSAECYDDLVRALTKEDRFVEPAHLQLVCERLWTARGAELARRAAGPAALPEVGVETVVSLGGTRGILESFFREFLAALDPADRFETLEMLELLVTAGGTRNIMERQRLVGAPLRDPARRGRLLALLEDHTLVRTERRLGGEFVEITHEFLIRPILDAFPDDLHGSAEYSGFLWAARTCEHLVQFDFSEGTSYLLGPKELAILRKHGDRVRPDARVAELLLRSAVAQACPAAELRYWLAQFRMYGRDLGPDDRDAVPDLLRPERLLTLEELRAVNHARATLDLSAEQVKHILRSELAKARETDRDDLVYWTRRLLSHGS